MEAKDETKERLEILSDMIRSVYLPLMESKQDSKIAMEKFVKSVKTSMQQAYGNITIYVPELPDASYDELCANKPLIEELMSTIVSTLLLFIQVYIWTQFIMDQAWGWNQLRVGSYNILAIDPVQNSNACCNTSSLTSQLYIPI